MASAVDSSFADDEDSSRPSVHGHGPNHASRARCPFQEDDEDSEDGDSSANSRIRPMGSRKSRLARSPQGSGGVDSVNSPDLLNMRTDPAHLPLSEADIGQTAKLLAPRIFADADLSKRCESANRLNTYPQSSYEPEIAASGLSHHHRPQNDVDGESDDGETQSKYTGTADKTFAISQSPMFVTDAVSAYTRKPGTAFSSKGTASSQGKDEELAVWRRRIREVMEAILFGENGTAKSVHRSLLTRVRAASRSDKTFSTSKTLNSPRIATTHVTNTAGRSPLQRSARNKTYIVQDEEELEESEADDQEDQIGYDKYAVTQEERADGIATEEMALDQGKALAATPTVDPPRYCLCNAVEYGDMIACDNNCSILWFHIGCVELDTVPDEGLSWYCPDCREVEQLGQYSRGLFVEKA